MPRTTKINSKSSTPKQNAPPPTHASTPKQNAPPPTHATPPPSYTPVQAQAPSMFDTIKQGFSFGVGSSIAHNIFDSKSKNEHTNTNANTNANANTITNETKLTSDKIYELYNKCLDNNINNNNNIDCNIIFQNMNNK
jgi:hypothetical protein